MREDYTIAISAVGPLKVGEQLFLNDGTINTIKNECIGYHGRYTHWNKIKVGGVWYYN